MPRFVRKHDNGNIEIFAFSGTSVVGRSHRAAVVIDDHSISATHARLEQKPDGYWIEDLDSRNGTRINEKEVKKELLKSGDQVRFGKILVTYESDEAEAAAPAKAEVPAAVLAVGITGHSPMVVRTEAPKRATEAPKVAAVAEAERPAPAKSPAETPPAVPVPIREAVARARAGGEGDMKLRVLKDQVRALQNQRVILAALTCGLALTTVIFLIAFLIYRTKALELEHGIGRPVVEDK
ncbi:MAG: FHA domain-containing protein [Planctomycetes bacterium]|nr:FHA domain-containing protein [Planctomycetota bacterium]